MKQMLSMMVMLGLIGVMSTGCETMGSCEACTMCAAGDSANELVAVMHPTEGNSTQGVVRFMKVDGGVKVVARIGGLSPNGTHAIHVHEFGDATDKSGKSAGGHYNPEGHDHGLPETDHRHAGDLGNLKADANGNANYTIVVKNVSLSGKHNPIIGRGVIIHAKADDGGQPTGNAGARISIGVIGVAKTE